ncbi:CocE/NonD family hydrolase [Amycolatopsis sp. GM8]|uniref:CocE/NonD family hydrolase n=1 Tax=Amycolatopsis sp. GM8 TaxID=2896530 RepID=UPI001F01DEA4|nr:CocE/NonD family hydrolase [Amycolatopsis sp. GM8]
MRVEIRRDVRIPTRDPEVTLSADVYLPVDAAPVPALVSVYPYRKDMSAFGAKLHWFAEHGYAGVLVDLRGTGSSDGARRPEFDPAEGDDPIAAIEWAAAQSWCDGAVGMWGASYGALLTMRAASRRPPLLKAIIPMIGPLDPELDLVHPDGARGDLHPMAFRGTLMMLEQLIPPLLNTSSAEEQRRWRRRLREGEPIFDDFVEHGPGDPIWRERAIDASAIEVPALCVGGWRDKNADAIPRAFERFTGPKKLLMGPWMHTSPEDSPFETVDFLPIALRWWDHWLRGIDTGLMAEPPVTLYLQGERPGWRSYDSWPPATKELVLTVGTDGVLADPAVAPPGVVGEYRPDPTTGALSGLWGLAANGIGLPVDQREDDLRALTATSAPLPDDLIVCGRAEVTVSTEAPAQRLVVRLADVDPEGRSMFLAAGVRCGSAGQVTLWPIAHRVKAGHRLRVVVSDSDFPRLMPLPAPEVLRVTGIDVTIPTVPEDTGAVVRMPYVRRPESMAVHEWAVTRELVDDILEVRIGGASGPVRTSQGHLLETDSETIAKVRRDAPGAAVVSRRASANVRLRTGEHVEVSALVRCTRTDLWARGTVTIDGAELFSRTWEAVRAE